MRMAINTTGPVNTCECKRATSLRILKRQQGRKIMFFRVARLSINAGQPELPPQLPLLDHHQRVAFRQDEELRPHAEVPVRDLRHQRVESTRVVPVREERLVGEDLDEAAVGIGEVVVDVREGVERDAVLRDESEVEVVGIVEDGACYQSPFG